MMQNNREQNQTNGNTKPPIRILAVIFAALLNLILVSLVFLASSTWLWSRGTTLLIVAAMGVLAGVLTAFYVGRRSGIHAFLGGMLSIPLIGWLSSSGDWQMAIYAGASCALGGLLLEKFGPERFRTPTPRRSDS